MNPEIKKLEQEIMQLSGRLEQLRKQEPVREIKDYEFSTPSGKVKLSELFVGKEILFAIHNMGQGCRYCTLWADGLNGFLPHLEDQFAVVLLSKDSPETQKQFAHSRQWRFRMASHSGANYIEEQGVGSEKGNYPGIVCYEKQGDKIFRKNESAFGPGDQFCSIWHILSLAGIAENDFTPQYNYWQRPSKMDDCGADLR